MDYPRPCGCKGCRTCIVCEKEFGIPEKEYVTVYKKEKKPYTYCWLCAKLYPIWKGTDIVHDHPNHSASEGILFPGVYIQPDFISLSEEKELIKGIDAMSWDISQSGRRKQNFGPRTNFKKMKLQARGFEGFPEFTQFIQERFKTVPLLSDFQTIEQCSLEYDPEKGASIDPHIDDCWIWGERVVTVNCLSDSVLTLAIYEGDNKKYNLACVDNYESALLEKLNEHNELDQFAKMVIRIPMPNRSLIVLYGPPRYQWVHSVLREDITSRRVCIAYREFTTPYLTSGDHEHEGRPVLHLAKKFFKSP